MHKQLVAVLALGVGIVLSVTAAPVNALTIGLFREMAKSDDEAVRMMVASHAYGIGVGLQFANSEVTRRGDQGIVCPPGQTIVNMDLVLTILDEELRNPSIDRAYPDDAPLAIPIVRGFQRRYPCPQP